MSAFFDFFRCASAKDSITQSLATLHQKVDQIMSAISDFKVKQDAHNQKVSDDLDAIAAQVKTMNDLIAKLQTSPGTITPEDQATLDQLDAAGAALATKADAMIAVTPPVVPAA